jgi:hypothetical protein
MLPSYYGRRSMLPCCGEGVPSVLLRLAAGRDWLHSAGKCAASRTHPKPGNEKDARKAQVIGRQRTRISPGQMLRMNAFAYR